MAAPIKVIITDEQRTTLKVGLKREDRETLGRTGTHHLAFRRWGRTDCHSRESGYNPRYCI